MCLSTVYLFGMRNYGDPKTIMPPICKVNGKENFTLIIFSSGSLQDVSIEVGVRSFY